MIRSLSLRSTVTTIAAAAVLVSGASLASYAANGNAHSAKTASSARAAQPRTIKFHLGAPGKVYNAGTFHLFTAKVPKGTYSVGLSGVFLASSASGQSYDCLLSDKKSLLNILTNPSGTPNFSRIYNITGQSSDDGTFAFGILDATNPVATIDRSTIVYGCIFNGGTPYTVGRTPTFSLTPVKTTGQAGKPLPLPKSEVRKMAGLLR
jgi:hypothetical protein